MLASGVCQDLWCELIVSFGDVPIHPCFRGVEGLVWPALTQGGPSDEELCFLPRVQMCLCCCVLASTGVGVGWRGRGCQVEGGGLFLES